VDRLGVDALSPLARRPPAIGLTGGIGSGKSTVAARLAGHGAAIVDTDAIAHALTAPGGEAMPPIEAAFGRAAIAADGALDRAAMRAAILAEPAAKRRLESILHPLIGAQARRQADAAVARGAPMLVFDVPLLAESAHWRARVDRVLVIDCDEAVQRRRVLARSGWPEAQVRAVIAAQATRARRRAVADAVIFNQAPDGGDDLQALLSQVDALWALWKNLGASAPP
jgi:dephospho-CoA kinase